MRVLVTGGTGFIGERLVRALAERGEEVIVLSRRSGESKHATQVVWTPETVSRLFEVGPMQYTPGTKMPEQKIGSAEDRKALVDFLAKAAKPK